MSNKYYVDIEQDGFNKKAYAKAFVFAEELAKQDSSVKRIVCYIHTKTNIGYFEPFFEQRFIKRLFEGNVIVSGFTVPLTIATQITYAKSQYVSSSNDIVIAFGMDLEDLEVLDDYYCVKYIIAVPWLKDKTMPWVRRWNAEEISGKNTSPSASASSLSDVAKVAFKDLTDSINMSTGISHPYDNSQAKTYIRALYKYEPSLQAEAVVSYLVTELGWTSMYANDVGKLISTLNHGRDFRGGTKTGLQVYYKHWKDKVDGKE